MTDLLSPAQVERLPVGSILFPAEHGKATGSALIVIPGRLLTQIAQLPERAGGEEPGGDPIPAWGIKEFFLIQKGKGRLPTAPTAHRHALAWYRKMMQERRIRSHHTETTEGTMPDLHSKLVRLAYENPGEVREALLPLLKEADFGFGSRILWKLVDQRKVLQVTSNLYKTDKQAAELLTDVTTELIDQLEPKNRRVEAAINRLSGLARGPQDPANLRNQIFKIAHELGMRLPSHSF